MIGNYSLPKNTIIALHQTYIYLSEKYWDKPLEFNPNRFLDEQGRYVATNPAFIPFSLGRRICPGEPFAITNLLLAMVRFLQLTNDYNITIDGKHDTDILEPDPKLPIVHHARNYKIKFIKIGDNI